MLDTSCIVLKLSHATSFLSALDSLLLLLVSIIMLLLAIRGIVYEIRQSIYDFLRMKKELLDPLIKPTDFEERYWDPKNGIPRDIRGKDGQRLGEAGPQFSWHPIIVACGMAAIVITVFVSRDNVLVLVAIVLIPVSVTYCVHRFLRSKRRNVFTLEDHDDFWNT